MIKPDRWIKKMAQENNMIEPFEPGQVKEGMSYGVSSYGYDFRLAEEFKIFQPKEDVEMDPKNYPSKCFDSYEGESCLIPPNSFILARSLEYFRIPRNILTICEGKSSYARCGIIVNVTPFEPEWEGYVTMEISNTAPNPARVYANEGIAQVLFLESDEECEISYKDRKGKYQSQKKITSSKT